jgi:predicted HTH domain antitoxin
MRLQRLAWKQARGKLREETIMETHDQKAFRAAQEPAGRDTPHSSLQEQPQARLDRAIEAYQSSDISLAQAAHLAGISYDSMKELLVQRGVQLRIGPSNDAELAGEIDVLENLLDTIKSNQHIDKPDSMISETKPLAVITQEAFQLLYRELGVVNTVRFLRQFTTGYGNYTEERDELFANLTLADLLNDLKRQQ